MAPELIAQVCYEAGRAAGFDGPLWKDVPVERKNELLADVRDVLANPKPTKKESDADTTFRKLVLALADGI